MKNLARLLAILCVASMLLAGCVPAPAAPAAEEPAEAEPITLKFVSWQATEPGFMEWWQGLIDEFESTHPNVTIEFTQLARTDFADTLITQFAGGDPPEITHLAAFEFPQFAQEGWLEPLDPWMEGTDIQANWTGQSGCVWDGKNQCIMLLYFGMSLAYNEKMLEEAGVDVPTNWDELLEASRALTKDTDGDGAMDQFGFGVTTIQGSAEMSDIFNFILGAGGNWTDKDGKPTINTPEVIEGLSQWKQLLQEGLTPLDLKTSDVRQLMNQGKVAMRTDGPWIWATLQGANEDVLPHLKVAPSPFHPPVGGESNVIAMPKGISEEKKKLVWDFIYLLTRPEWQADYTRRAGSPAPRKGSIPDDVKETNPYIDVFVDAMQEASDAEVHRTPIGLETHVNEFVKLLHEQSQAMYIQDKSPADAAADLQKAVEELQARE